MARVTVAFNIAEVRETIREFAELYAKHGHRLSRYSRQRLDRLASEEGRLCEVHFDLMRDGVIPVSPSGDLLAAIADLRVVANGASS